MLALPQIIWQEVPEVGDPCFSAISRVPVMLHTRLGQVDGGDVGVGRGHAANNLELKHSTIYKKMFYRVNTLLGSLTESCKGLVQLRNPPPKDSGFISFILNPSVGLIISWLRDPLGPPKSSVNTGSAGQDSSTGPTPRPHAGVLPSVPEALSVTWPLLPAGFGPHPLKCLWAEGGSPVVGAGIRAAPPSVTGGAPLITRPGAEPGTALGERLGPWRPGLPAPGGPLWLRWSLGGLPRDLEASFYTPEVERSCPRATSEWDEECLQTPPPPPQLPPFPFHQFRF